MAATTETSGDDDDGDDDSSMERIAAAAAAASRGRVFRSVAAFLADRVASATRLPDYKEGDRVASATRLPDYKEGGDEVFKAMLAALRGGPANAAAAESVGSLAEPPCAQE